MRPKLYGGVELGGTKTICAIADADGNLSAHTIFPTTSVDETFDAIFEFFEQNVTVVSLGVGSFGPVQLNQHSSEYGYIYNSPKSGWSRVDVKGALEARLKTVVTIDTDVNCAAIGELYFGVAKQARNFIYLTLGTGIGGSLISDGKVIHGILNLEMGHVRVPHEPFTDNFKGTCAYHGDCLEGISSGFALAQRFGRKSEDITDKKIWDTEAEYIASALHNLMMTIGPEIIVLGGGLTNHTDLIKNIRTKVRESINSYLEFPDLENYIRQSSGEINGVLGAIKLTSLSD